MAGNSIAKGVLTLIPKFEGDALSSIEKQLEKSGNSGAAKMTGTISAGLKKLAAAGAVVEAGKLLGDTFAQSFNLAADYEQLVGGVETLFGKANVSVEQFAKTNGVSLEQAAVDLDHYGDQVSRVMDNAKIAYRTAGLSTNDYMETVTSFSASLISSLGEYSYQAAAYADMAITDMSDNANKMGTDMQSIQNAYQGFAKGNFTMLDNLKLGYGGTKEEMERLLRKAEELEGLDTGSLSVDNFADIVDAIHAVQDELGITGTTMSEASETVSGSIAMLKASWDNLLTAMGSGEGVEEAANQIVESFITALKNIIPLAAQVIVGMAGAVKTALGNLLVQGVNVIAAKYGEFEQAAANLIRGMVAGLSPSAVLEKIRSICSQAVDQIKSFFGIHSPSTVMRDLFGYVGEGMALGLDDSQRVVDRSMDDLLNSAYGKAAGFGVGLNARVNGGRATNADVVGAINTLHNDLYAIIKDATPDGITGRQFGRLVHRYA